MQNCPICQKTAKSLHSETLFPAWMQAPNSESLEICEPCQKRFERNAAFTVEFFKDRHFFKKVMEPDYYETFYGAEFHHRSARVALLYFLVGLALKKHHVLANKGEDLLGGAYDRIAQDYNGRFLEEKDYAFWGVYQSADAEKIEDLSRARVEDLNALEVCIYGYRFFLITDQRPLEPDSLIRKLFQEQDLVIPQLESEKANLYEDFEAFIEERDSRKK